uniref:Neur_chan_memb domain-containing protein n=1 Tax=Globodera pallida TaxID=36090 RepID=A0A183C828_GLOPA
MLFIHHLESLAFHRDPFNRPELVHTLRGRELFLFVVLYALGVVAIVFMFESTMPVFWVDDRSRAEQRRRAAIVFSRSTKTVLRDRELPFGGIGKP